MAHGACQNFLCIWLLCFFLSTELPEEVYDETDGLNDTFSSDDEELDDEISAEGELQQEVTKALPRLNVV